jgi:hypothetical protein
MAIAVARDCEELEKLGFKQDTVGREFLSGRMIYYTIERTVINYNSHWESLEAFTGVNCAVIKVCENKPVWSMEDIDKFAIELARNGYRITKNLKV